MSSYRRMTDSLPTCMNCGAVLYGGYCSHCGQRNTAPITWRSAVAEAMRRIKSMDSRWLRTVAALTVDPGRMVRRYLRGRRIPYVEPPIFALAAVALCLAVVTWQNVELTAAGTPWTVSENSSSSATPSKSASSSTPDASSTAGSSPESPDDPEHILARTVLALSVASSLLVAAATALVQMHLYRTHGFNWTQTYVFELYVFGLLALHQTLFALLGAFASTVGLVALAIVIVLFLAFALSGFYRKSLVSSLPAALLLATVQVAGIFVVGALARIALRG